jgi:hypothetical protein
LLGFGPAADIVGVGAHEGGEPVDVESMGGIGIHNAPCHEPGLCR